jgi:hypothetical protein
VDGEKKPIVHVDVLTGTQQRTYKVWESFSEVWAMLRPEQAPSEDLTTCESQDDILERDIRTVEEKVLLENFLGRRSYAAAPHSGASGSSGANRR